MNRFLLVAFFFFPALRELSAEEFTLVLQTKTGHVNAAGTNAPAFFAVHYMDSKEVPNRNPKKPPRVVPDQRRIEVLLDTKGNDREAGAVDTYTIKFECPVDKICGVEIGLKSGDDAWLIDGFQYRIETDKKISEVVQVPFSGWLSGAANEKVKSKQFYYFKAPSPKLKDKPNPK